MIRRHAVANKSSPARRCVSDKVELLDRSSVNEDTDFRHTAGERRRDRRSSIGCYRPRTGWIKVQSDRLSAGFRCRSSIGNAGDSADFDLEQERSFRIENSNKETICLQFRHLVRCHRLSEDCAM